MEEAQVEQDAEDGQVPGIQRRFKLPVEQLHRPGWGDYHADGSEDHDEAGEDADRSKQQSNHSEGQRKYRK